MGNISVPSSQIESRALGILSARSKLGGTPLELLWDDFMPQATSATYANTGGTAAQGSTANRGGIAQLRAGAAISQNGQAFWSDIQIGNVLTQPYLMRGKLKLSSASIAGTARHVVGAYHGGTSLGVGIGAVGAGNTGGSNSAFTLLRGDSGGTLQGGAQFATALDTVNREFEIWYTGTGLIYATLGNAAVSMVTNNMSSSWGQCSAFAMSGDQVGAANGMDLDYFQVLTTRV